MRQEALELPSGMCEDVYNIDHCDTCCYSPFRYRGNLPCGANKEAVLTIYHYGKVTNQNGNSHHSYYIYRGWWDELPMAW